MACGYGATGKKTTGYDCVMIPGGSTFTNGAMKGDSVGGRIFNMVIANAIATVSASVCCEYRSLCHQFLQYSILK